MRKRSDPGFNKYAADTMLSLVHQLQHEIEGVKTSDNIEFIHQSRVFSRRLREALIIFETCLPEEQVEKWTRKVRDITRSLGEARDLDVQIEFIKSYMDKYLLDHLPFQIMFYPGVSSDVKLSYAISDKNLSQPVQSEKNKGIGLFIQYKKNPEDKESGISGCFSSGDELRPGLECLLLRLIQHRESIQPEIIRAIDLFDKSDLIGSITTLLHEIKVQAMLEESDSYSLFGYEQAFIHIMFRIQELFWYETWLSEPAMSTRHHEMRIAAKHLRYALELFSGLFEDNLKSEIKTFKKLQDILGEIHDCDVWIQLLPDVIKNEKRASTSYFGNDNFFELVEPGLSGMLLDRRKERERLFSELQSLWSSLKDDGFWDRIEEKISVPLQGGFFGNVSSCLEGTIRIALISDIHANLPALEAVLADAQARGVSAVINAGDSIGYGAFPDEIISLLRSSHVLSVMGNYDRSVLAKKWKTKRLKSRDKQIAMRYAYHYLTPENRAYLKLLPDHIRFKIRGKSILITHGSPDSLNEYLVKETPASRFSELAATSNADIIITGHSHLPLILEKDGVWFINCGSVGRTEDGDPRACYALLTLDPFSVMHIRVPYDIDRAIEALRVRHLPESFIRVISEGKPIDIVQESEDKN